MAGLKLTWMGDAVQAKVLAAAKAGIEDTVQATAAEARSTTWRGGDPRRHPGEPHAGDTVYAGPAIYNPWMFSTSAIWGSKLWRYIFIEAGVRGRPGGHFLRQAADHEYPRLAQRIRSHLG